MVFLLTPTVLRRGWRLHTSSIQRQKRFFFFASSRMANYTIEFLAFFGLSASFSFFSFRRMFFLKDVQVTEPRLMMCFFAFLFSWRPRIFVQFLAPKTLNNPLGNFFTINVYKLKKEMIINRTRQDRKISIMHPLENLAVQSLIQL